MHTYKAIQHEALISNPLLTLTHYNYPTVSFKHFETGKMKLALWPNNAYNMSPSLI